MANIRQTVPAYSAGISEQPDHLKFPGQVKNAINAVPDITKGLFKRPGARRVGTAKLPNVQSGGSFFHYYRDDNEGSYIGQVAPNGQLRLWKASGRNAGVEQTVVYGTGGQTAITNYLATSDSENIQFLSINDTTFVSNRDIDNANTLVGTTGTTDGRPSGEEHCALIELTRTENGRQYAANIYDDSSTGNLTTVTRATKIKITGNNFDETDGSGSCPGIGTEVYSVTAKSSYSATENITHVRSGTADNEPLITSGKENLVFRATALGQQGISPNYQAEENGADGQNYRCSYSLEVVLLHGGEGWSVNDTIRIIPEHASAAANVQPTSGSQAYIDVTVVEVETTQVKATVASNGDGLIRPSPTPFDADTAVTAESILGSLAVKVNAISGITSKVIGTCLYISSANPFTIEVMEDDIMRVFQKTVNDVSRLPVQCRHGYIVKVSNARISDEDDYYLRFEGENNLDGSGSWVECAKPGIAKSLTNMPLVIQRTAITNQNTNSEVATFTVKQYTYADRAVGDETTNPLPSFVGKRINKVVFFRNRLAFLAGENVVMTRPGSFAEPDFFAESALAVGANDAIDIACASTFPSDLFDGIEVNSGLLVLSTNQQFLLSSDAEILNPETAKLRSISTYNYNKDIPPISLGVTIAYVDNSGKFSRFNEVANIRREGEPDVVEPSKIVPSLLAKDIDLLTNSRENAMVLFGKTGTRDVFGFRYFNIGDKRQQQAWFRWRFNKGLLYHFIINDDYYFLDENHFLQTLSLVEDDNDISITQDNVEYLIHLDNYTTLAAGSYDAATNKTTFTNKANWIPDVTSPNNKLVVIDIDSGLTRVGRYAETTLLGNNPNDDFTLPGNWSTGTFYIGYLYDYQVDFPTIYPTQIQGEKSNTDVSGMLVLHRLRVHLGKVGLYETTLTRLGKPTYTEIYESTELDEYEASDAPYVEEVIQTVPVYEKNTNLDFTLKSTHPSPATLRALSWEGSFTPKYYKRV